MTDESEISKAARDAFVHGMGMMRDGKHVPVGDVYMTAKEAAADDLVKRLLIAADRADTVFDPDFALPWREATACIEQQKKRIEELEAALHLGIDMREKQKAYFKRRFQDVLLDCKKAESAFDKAAIAALGEKKDDASA